MTRAAGGCKRTPAPFVTAPGPGELRHGACECLALNCSVKIYRKNDLKILAESIIQLLNVARKLDDVIVNFSYLTITVI